MPQRAATSVRAVPCPPPPPPPRGRELLGGAAGALPLGLAVGCGVGGHAGRPPAKASQDAAGAGVRVAARGTGGQNPNPAQGSSPRSAPPRPPRAPLASAEPAAGEMQELLDALNRREGRHGTRA